MTALSSSSSSSPIFFLILINVLVLKPPPPPFSMSSYSSLWSSSSSDCTPPPPPPPHPGPPPHPQPCQARACHCDSVVLSPCLKMGWTPECQENKYKTWTHDEWVKWINGLPKKASAGSPKKDGATGWGKLKKGSESRRRQSHHHHQTNTGRLHQVR